MKKGFTLIELLVVIAIIGILATIVTVSTTSARKQGRDAKRRADINAVSGALEMYYAQIRSYPNTGYSGLSALLSPYLSTMPSDPGSYSYTYTGTPAQTQYVLDAQLELGTTADLAGACPPATGSANFFKTGTCCTNGKNCHYRVSNK